MKQQKDSRLTIGQRIDVFKSTGEYLNIYNKPIIPIGWQSAGFIKNGFPVVRAITGKQFLVNQRDVRKVGTLVVTKLKGEDGV